MREGGRQNKARKPPNGIGNVKENWVGSPRIRGARAYDMEIDKRGTLAGDSVDPVDSVRCLYAKQWRWRYSTHKQGKASISDRLLWWPFHRPLRDPRLGLKLPSGFLTAGG